MLTFKWKVFKMWKQMQIKFSCYWNVSCAFSNFIKTLEYQSDTGESHRCPEIILFKTAIFKSFEKETQNWKIPFCDSLCQHSSHVSPILCSLLCAAMQGSRALPHWCTHKVKSRVCAPFQAAYRTAQIPDALLRSSGQRVAPYLADTNVTRLFALLNFLEKLI